MKLRVRNELVLLNLLVFALVAVISLSPSNVLRIVLGLPFLLFFPGYCLVSALFPKRDSMSAIERVVMSSGISIAVVALIGLILNSTPWGIRLEPVVYSTASFIFITSLIAMLRRTRLAREERFSIEFTLRLPGWGGGAFDRLLAIVFVVVLLGSLGGLGYAVSLPRAEEAFTEFYILGPSGRAEDYPAEFVMQGDRVVLVRYGQDKTQEVAAESGSVILAVVNREGEAATYLIRTGGEVVKVYFAGEEVAEIGPIELASQQMWQHEIGLVPQHIGDGQKVEFTLLKDGTPYLELHLFIDVRAR